MKTLCLLVLSLVAALCLAASCSSVVPVVRTIADLARDYCVLMQSEQKPGVSAQEVQKQFCTTQEQLKPFEDAILQSKAGLARQLQDGGVGDAGADAPLTIYVAPTEAAPRDGSAG